MRYCILDSTSPLPSVEELTELYDSVGWSAYTKTPERLIPMLEGSRYLYTARETTPEGTGRLIGLVRAVGDGQSIAYIQDLLVHPHAQRQGIGSALLKRAIDDFDREDIRQRLITTDVASEHVCCALQTLRLRPRRGGRMHHPLHTIDKAISHAA